ncbi:hypothetical protein [Granulicella aggregans]|uniref:hypothetical protein n=1 Tax=Granulicella aggregans TaxID=474949 RepID=UPI0021E0913C|nr:hypothetical protein [Granulicella aggregans]
MVPIAETAAGCWLHTLLGSDVPAGSSESATRLSIVEGSSMMWTIAPDKLLPFPVSGRRRLLRLALDHLSAEPEAARRESELGAEAPAKMRAALHRLSVEGDLSTTGYPCLQTQNDICHGRTSCETVVRGPMVALQIPHAQTSRQRPPAAPLRGPSTPRRLRITAT